MRVDNISTLERREFKYLVRQEDTKEMVSYLQGICTADAHAGPNGSYPIRSLYLDTERYHLYYANQHEKPDRFKARIRTYPHGNADVWLEIKQRHIDTIKKSRVRIAAELWQDLVEDPSSFKPSDFKKVDAGLVERFLWHLQSYHLRPRVLVEYDREAYVSTLDNYARVTFDRGIRCQLQDRWSVDAPSWCFRAVDHPKRIWANEPLCVLELKFGSLVPRWMALFVQKFEIIRYSFSKYCYSIDAHYLLPHSHVAGIQARRW